MSSAIPVKAMNSEERLVMSGSQAKDSDALLIRLQHEEPYGGELLSAPLDLEIVWPNRRPPAMLLYKGVPFRWSGNTGRGSIDDPLIECYEEVIGAIIPEV